MPVRPSQFGPAWWLLLHYVCWVDGGDAAADLLMALPLLLPCSACRARTYQLMSTMPLQASPLAASVTLHAAVNAKLGVRQPFPDMLSVVQRRFTSGAVTLTRSALLAALYMSVLDIDFADPLRVAALRLGVSALRRALCVELRALERAASRSEALAVLEAMGAPPSLRLA